MIDGEDYNFVLAVVENRVSYSLTPAGIEKASAEDMELNSIKECVEGTVKRKCRLCSKVWWPQDGC